MSRIENIERYLRANLSVEHAGGTRGIRPVSRAFVTISRQSGTGAHALAESIVSIFDAQDDAVVFGGWKVYDRSICDIVARDPRFARSLDALLDEEYRAKSIDMLHQLMHATPDQSATIDRAFVVVRAIAEMGKAIIIGRAGSQVTRDLPQGVSMRLVASSATRVSTAMERFGSTERDTRADIKRRDASRSRMVRDRFGVDIEDPCEYDVTWNMGTTTHIEIANAVVDLVRDRVISG